MAMNISPSVHRVLPRKESLHCCGATMSGHIVSNVLFCPQITRCVIYNGRRGALGPFLFGPLSGGRARRIVKMTYICSTTIPTNQLATG